MIVSFNFHLVAKLTTLSRIRSSPSVVAIQNPVVRLKQQYSLPYATYVRSERENDSWLMYVYADWPQHETPPLIPEQCSSCLCVSVFETRFWW